jgi:CubicO group peptidase (beta-lactamase class C family)
MYQICGGTVNIALLMLLTLMCGSARGNINVSACTMNETENYRLDSTSRTPAFTTMGKIFEAINTADIATQKSIVNEYMTSGLRRKLGGTENISLRWAQTINTHGEMLLDSIIFDSPTRIDFWARGAISKSWFRIELEVEEDPPYAASVMRLFQGVRPRYAPMRSTHTEKGGLQSSLEQYFSRLASKDFFSGSVLVAKAGSVVFRGAYGFARKEDAVRSSSSTPFNMASAGKMFTAVLIGTLVDEKHLALDDPIGKYLPDCPPAIGTTVTIRHLLNHTGGIEADIFGPEYNEEKDSITTVRGFLRFVDDDAPATIPGTKHNYSNGGFVLLGAVIESVTGKDFYAFAKEKLFEPLKMTSTGYFLKNDPAIALGYTPRASDAPGAYAWGERKENTSILGMRGSPAGGCYSSAEDLYTFMRALVSGNLLSEATLNDFTRKGIVVFQEAGYVNEYASGFQISRINSSWCFGHRGGAPGASSRVEYNPDLGYYVIVLSNYDTMANIAGDYIRDEIVP